MAVFLRPEWFTGPDVLFEFTFAVVALLVAVYAFRVFRLTKSRNALSLGAGFLLMSVSYLSLSLMNASAIFSIAAHDGISYGILRGLAILSVLTLYTHVLLYILGLASLSCIALKDKSAKAFLLISLPSIIALLLSPNTLLLFHVLSSFFLVVISFQYWRNYAKKKQGKALMIAIAFFLLLLGRIHFIFSPNHEIFYPIGHALELLSYVLILISLALTHR